MDGPLILTLSCADRPGITARVAGYLFERGCNILSAQQFDDRSGGPGDDRFFMRVAFDPGDNDAETLRAEFRDLAGELAMDWKIVARDRPRRTMILVSKFDHCLVDLLYRWRTGELNIDPVAVVSNHPRDVAIKTDIGTIPFHYLPVNPQTKPRQEAQLRDLAEQSGAELVVLARYMQIFSNALSGHFAGRCINIHHSFLPGFKGARPYHQAHERGVKIIGATAHFVTADLDEGPIIHQDIERVTHEDTADDLVRKGRDIERRVLAEAVRLFAEDRVLLNGNRTVVFRG